MPNQIYDAKPISGTSAEKTELESSLGVKNVGLEFTVVGGETYRWNGSEFFISGAAGAKQTEGPILTLVKYAGSGYTYLCEARPGTARSTAAWRVERVTDATGDSVYAGLVGTTVGTFAFAATDLTTVAAHTYTLGA